MSTLPKTWGIPKCLACNALPGRFHTCGSVYERMPSYARIKEIKKILESVFNKPFVGYFKTF